MLTKSGHLAVMTAFISMFCVFVTAPHSCGALFFYARGAAPLYPAAFAPFQLLQAKVPARPVV